MSFTVLWDNGWACGTLPGTFDTEQEAATAGEEWLLDMISLDPDPAAAREVYSFDIIEEKQ